MWVRFKNGGYNHTWPSRAVTHYPDGSSHNVKRDVADAAISIGRAEKCTAPADNVEIAAGGDSQ